jgi:hypothetical protein
MDSNDEAIEFVRRTGALVRDISTGDYYWLDQLSGAVMQARVTDHSPAARSERSRIEPGANVAERKRRP